jgi:hypothetical protein
VKKSIIVLPVLLLSASLAAQVRTGTIWGHITDTQGAPLPGVSVTLRSPFGAPFIVVTDEQGIFRFISLEPSNKYALTAELQGFKKQEKTGIIVTLGTQSKIDMTLEQGKLEEEVTVVAVTPTVDARKTSVGKNVNQETLQSLPTARDPWNVMMFAPSIQMDRDNVGGSESGQQAGFYAKGDSTGGNNNVWAVDGIVVTDPASLSSPGYWDFDAFEEMNIVTGGADVTIQTGGVALNMVTRRGGNKVTFGGRFYLTDSAFQASNLTPALRALGLTGTNKINQIKDYGFNLGGPVVKDRAWLWGSYGVQDINAVNAFGTLQKPLLTNYNFKVNLQLISSNRFEFLWTAGGKTFMGRSAGPSYPEGYDQGQPGHWGSPIVKLQDEQMVGSDLLLSAKFAYSNPSFQLIPHNDPNLENLWQWDVTNDVNYEYGYYITTRPMYDYDFHTQYYNDKLFGVSHEIKLGVEYSTRRVTSDSTAPGQLLKMYNLNYPDMWWDLAPDSSSGNPGFTPGMTQWMLAAASNLDFSVKQLSAFLQDTVTTGRFNFLLGIRYDRQMPSINSSNYTTVDNNPVWAQYFDSDVKSALAAFFPGTLVPNIKPNYRWNVLSPRLGITYDLFGTGKTILKLSASMYGDFMGTSSSNYLFNPYGAPPYFGGGAQMYFWWRDANGDGKAQANELYGNDPTTYAPIPLIVDGAVNPVYRDNTQFNQWWGFTPNSSTAGPSAYTVDPKAGSSRTWELLFTIDHELLPDFSVSLNATYRKYNHFSWDPAYYADGPYGNYSIDGQNVILGPDASLPDSAATIPSTITYTDDSGTHTVSLGAGPGHTVYMLDPTYTGTPYSYHTLNTDYETYWGIDLSFNKRLSNKWMLDGSVSYQGQKYHYGNGYIDATNLWALQDQLFAPAMGLSSGKIVDAYIFSPWLLKLEGLYQLPLGFDISFTFNARAGHPIPHYMYIVDYTWPNPLTQVKPYRQAYLDIFGTTKLPTFYQLNLRLEKMIKLGDTGRIYLMADAFNVTNAATINRRYDMREGTYYIYTDGTTSFSPYAHNYQAYEILNPLVMRLGVRFQF